MPRAWPTGCPDHRPRQALLVFGVPGLVEHAHQGLGEVVLVVAGRDADVLRHAAAKGVVTDVEPAVREIEADRFHRGKAEPRAGLRWGRALAGA